MERFLFIYAAALGLIAALVWPAPAATHNPAPAPAVDVLALIDTKLRAQERALARDPYNHMACSAIAGLLLRKARVTGDETLIVRAEEMASRSLELLPKGNPEASAAMAMAMAALHHFGPADAVAAKAFDAAPYATYFLYIRADARFAMGDYATAKALVTDLAAREPGYNVWTRRAHLAAVFGDDAEAVRCWGQALATCPAKAHESRAWTLLMRGIVDLKHGSLADARGWFERALAVYPGYYLALEHIAETWETAGEPAKAKPLLEQAIAVKRDPGLLMRLAAITGGDEGAALRDEALAQVEALVASGQIGHYRALATILMDLGRDLPRALELANMDLGVRHDIGAYATLARAQRLNGDAASALKSIERALQHGTRDAGLWSEKAADLRALGRAAEADAALRTARSINRYAQFAE